MPPRTPAKKKQGSAPKQPAKSAPPPAPPRPQSIEERTAYLERELQKAPAEFQQQYRENLDM